jgi:hypothetical protein
MEAQLPLDMDEGEQRSSPLAGPGTTRANRRLQLRKNGFRGRVLPNRNITPKRRISDAWSSPAQQDDTPTSDLPPQPESNKAYLSARGRSSSILQEVSNSSLRRKDKNKNKHDSVLSVFADENGDDKAWNFESSPAWYHETTPPCMYCDTDSTSTQSPARSTKPHKAETETSTHAILQEQPRLGSTGSTHCISRIRTRRLSDPACLVELALRDKREGSKDTSVEPRHSKTGAGELSLGGRV